MQSYQQQQNQEEHLFHMIDIINKFICTNNLTKAQEIIEEYGLESFFEEPGDEWKI